MYQKLLLFTFVFLSFSSFSQNKITLTASETRIVENGSVEIIATIPSPTDKDIIIDFELSGTAKHYIDFTSEFGSKGRPSTIGMGEGSAANQFWYPNGVFVDHNGNIFVSDANNSRVQKWAPGATEGVTVAGGNGQGSGSNQLSYPVDVFVDSKENLYVSDYLNHRVQKWVPGATEGVTVAGGNGQGSHTNQLSSPEGIFVDESGDIYIADKSNLRIVKWVQGESNGSIIAGGNGWGNGMHQLNYPSSVYVDDKKDIYVSDTYNGRIQRFTPGETSGSPVAGGAYPYPLNYPVDVIFDKMGYMLIVDQSNHRLVRWLPYATDGITVAGSDSLGSKPNQLYNPEDVYLDKNGNIYVSDRDNHRIQRYQQSPQIEIKAGEMFGKLIINGISDTIYEYDKNLILTVNSVENGELSEFSSTAIDILIYDINNPPLVELELSSDKIIENSSTQVILSAFVQETTYRDIEIKFSLDGTALENSDFAVSSKSILIPKGGNSGSLAISTKGLDDILIETDQFIRFSASSVTNAILMQDSIILYLESDDDPEIAFSVSSLTISEHQSTEIIATLDSPASRDMVIAVSFSGTANHLSDYTTEFSTKGKITTIGTGRGPGLNQFSNPRGIFVDKDGNLFVADGDNARIQKWVPGSKKGITVAGGNEKGSASDQLKNPYDVFIGADGDIYISDYGNYRVQKWVSGSSEGITVAGGNGAGSNSNQLAGPSNIFVDKKGNVFIAELHNHRVMKWTPGADTGILIGGGGECWPMSNRLHYPSGVIVDSADNVLVADQENNRIVKFIPGSITAYTIVAPGYVGHNLYTLNNPNSISFDLEGNLLIADKNNNRIMSWLPGASKGIQIAGGTSAGNNSDQLNNPLDACMDKDGNLFVSDNGNHRILRYQYSPQIVIRAGETTGKISITGIEDKVNENDEIIVIKLTSVADETLYFEPIVIKLLDNSMLLTIKDSPFPGLSDGAVSWGDYDRDGDQDLAIMGKDSNSNLHTVVHENKEGVFVDGKFNLTGLSKGDISWVDLNKDGWLDLVMSGYNNNPMTNVYINNEGKSFASVDYNLPNLYRTKMAWGDLDNDGDIDLAVAGIDKNEKYLFQVYYKDDTQEKFYLDQFMEEPVSVIWPGFINGDLRIIDIDRDDDNDIIYSGEDSSGNPVGGYIYNTIENDGYCLTIDLELKNSTFEIVQFDDYTTYYLTLLAIGEDINGDLKFLSNPVMQFVTAKGDTAQLPQLKNGDISFADLNLDGLDDLIFTGEGQDGTPLTKLYIQDVLNRFKESEIQLIGLKNSSISLIDYNLDGDLDLFITGEDESGGISILYELEIKNKRNHQPITIAGLKTTYLGNGKIRFSWDKPSDYLSKSFGYSLRLSKTSGGIDIIPTESNHLTGNRLARNIALIYNEFYELQLDPGIYYWAVQAVDQGLEGGKFSDENSFTLSYDWKIINQGGVVDKKINSYYKPELRLVNVDNDKDLDLLYGGIGDIAYEKLYKFNGRNLIDSQEKVFGNLAIKKFEVGDVNTDGFPDILFCHDGWKVRPALFLSKGDGGFVKHDIENDVFLLEKGRIVDFDNDGQDEIIFMALDAYNELHIYKYNKTSSALIRKKNAVSPNSIIIDFDIGDVDKDGDFDIILSRKNYANNDECLIFENLTTPGQDYQFQKQDKIFASYYVANVDFFDFDTDGDLDILLRGKSFELYENQLNESTSTWMKINNSGLPALTDERILVGDINNDGFSELLYSGLVGGKSKTIINEFDHDKNTFANSVSFANDIINSNIDFGDIDGDGDLDVFISGQKPYEGYVSRIYLNMRNESAIALQKANNSSTAFLENKPPDVPVQKEVKLFKKLDNGNIQVEFSWDAPYDDHTPKTGLTYALKVGTTPGGNEIMSANANSDGVRNSTGKGNVEHNLKWHLTVPEGVYYWSVQAIDASYVGSDFSSSKLLDTKVLNDDPLELAEDLYCYPNPTTGKLAISIPSSDKQASLIIRDMQGSIVYNKAVNIPGDRTIETDISTLKNGIYTITIETNNERYMSKVVKK